MLPFGESAQHLQHIPIKLPFLIIINIVNICLFFLLTLMLSPSEGARVSGAMNRLWIVRSLRVNIKIMMNERKVMLSVLYGI